ncbi:hypothetical protein P280DRAFT_88850 [Massarina eburnea CBS 473.64]|uniref:SUZ domain-containing protein n=1 Tax=Massarina eburnea CBS 473.64 TaxID=1395130 RepID=A0A6A6RUU4_9PLEO|nr:hypothetical protein P280DRAFT_88850 [Massarina eburnea CBS 473.64]
MPPQKSAVADAWDDDWESQADKQDESEKEPPKLTKAQRRAQHAEFNRQIWESAENPEPLLFLEARNTVPVPSTFKPTMKVLARKPPQLLSRNDAAGDDEDSEEERRKKNEADFEERKARAQKERAEKERRYAEAREKIFGSPAASDESRASSPHKPGRGGKGRARAQAPGRQLYDPTYSPKPGSAYVQKKESSASRPSTPNGLEKPIREPRGPPASGRGGGGFAPRGNRAGANVS